MSAHDQLFGTHIPTGSWVHRLPVWSKYVLMFVGTIPSLLAREWWLAIVVLVVATALLLASRIPPRVSLLPPLYQYRATSFKRASVVVLAKL